MSLDRTIAGAVARAVDALYGLKVDEASIVPQATRKEFEGNLTVMVFPFVKAAHKAPEAVGAEIGQWLVDNEPSVAGFNVVKGFLNIVIKSSHWTDVLRSIENDPHFGIVEPTADSPLVMVEYSSPNTNKPLHLGHVRNNLLGYSLSRILQACGNKVVKTNIVNDRGIHIVNQPTIVVEGDKPDDLDEKLKRNNEDLLNQVDERFRQRADDERRGRYD